MKPVLRDNPDADIVERLKRVEGALTWQLAREYVPRRWAMQREVTVTNTTLAAAEQRFAALQAAQQSEPQRFEAFAARIAALESRIGGELPRVVALAREQQGVVQEIAIAALQEQKERLAAYTGQARFAIAQLVDKATTTDVAPGATRAPR
jgi:hypothetical protein